MGDYVKNPGKLYRLIEAFEMSKKLGIHSQMRNLGSKNNVEE